MNPEQIAKLIKPDSGQQFKGNDLRDLLGCGVYVLLESEVVLYIGLAHNLLRRISGLHHKKDLIERCDKLLMYPCVRHEAAVELERLLIFSLKPLHNTRQRTAHLQRLMGINRTPRAIHTP